MNIAFLGLGVMGYPMAGHLAAAGHTVTVYNRTTSKAEAWVAQHGGKLAKTPQEAAQGQDIVLACVGNDDDLRSVTTGPQGAFQSMAPGSIFIDHTTASADVEHELAAEATAKGIGYLDCPVSGGQVGAEKGQLTIMCGGEEATYTRAEPVLKTYAKGCRLMGAIGSGQLTKMANQICIAGAIQGVAEALHFGRQAGLDLDALIDVVSKGSGASWQLENRGPTMHRGQFDFGFAVDWIRKDLGICLMEARKNGAQIPVTALLDQFYAEVQKMGGGRWDSSSLIARLNRAPQ